MPSAYRQCKGEGSGVPQGMYIGPLHSFPSSSTCFLTHPLWIIINFGKQPRVSKLLDIKSSFLPLLFFVTSTTSRHWALWFPPIKNHIVWSSYCAVVCRQHYMENLTASPYFNMLVNAGSCLGHKKFSNFLILGYQISLWFNYSLEWVQKVHFELF